MRGPRRRPTRAVLEAALLVLLGVGCFPTTYGPHFRPAAAPAAGKARYHGAHCGGGYGAGEVIEMRGPSGARIYAYLHEEVSFQVRRAPTLEVTSVRKHEVARVGIYAATGTRVEFANSEFTIARADSGDSLRGAERTVRVDSVRVLSWDRIAPYGNGGLEARADDSIPSPRSFEGSARHGNSIWMEFNAAEALPARPRAVIMRLPAVTVNGAPWDPGPITFEYRSRERGTAPLNC